MSGSSSAQSFVTTAAAVAAVAGVSIPLLQLDGVSRRILSPDRLHAKRRAEYVYRWDKALQKATLRLRQELDFMNDTDAELLTIELLTTEEEIQNLVKQICSADTQPALVAMEFDEKDPRARREYFLYFVLNKRNYQVPIVPFGLALATAMDDQLTSTALCFVADASSGWGSHVLATVLEQCKAGVAVIRRPLWMAALAHLIEKRVIASSKMERILFGLCRMEALRVRSQVGAARTVAFTLPGQACTPALLPLLQRAFPCERHVFCYDGCVSSVQRGLLHRHSPVIDTVPVTTPLSTLPRSTLRGLSDALANLPLTQADTAEAWIASVDTFLKLKEEEKTNNYLPFVLKLSYILKGSLDDETSDRRLALTNVLQFMTGSRSRPLADGVMDAAVESLRDLCAVDETLPSLSAANKKSLDDCAFSHKGILIENKTLVDTVKPAKEWTLKAAKRISGCLCCAPEEEEDEDEEGTTGNTIMNGVDMSMPGAFAMALSTGDGGNTSSKRPKYVDGKSAFAFDPTKFSG